MTHNYGYNVAKGKKTTLPAVATKKAKLTTICHLEPTAPPPTPRAISLNLQCLLFCCLPSSGSLSLSLFYQKVLTMKKSQQMCSSANGLSSRGSKDTTINSCEYSSRLKVVPRRAPSRPQKKMAFLVKTIQNDFHSKMHIGFVLSHKHQH